MPQLRPATFIAVIVTVIGALRSFDLVSIMTKGGPFGESRVLSQGHYRGCPKRVGESDRARPHTHRSFLSLGQARVRRLGVRISRR